MSDLDQISACVDKYFYGMFRSDGDWRIYNKLWHSARAGEREG